MAIYLDHNAGAPLRTEVRDAISALFDSAAGNPSSVHHAGQTARRYLEHARAQVAALIGATPAQTLFTSGGTEANNLSILGAVRSRPGRRRIVSSAIEHSSILAPLARLEAEGFEVSKIAPDREGRLDPAWIVSLLDENTALVTLGLANSEVGTIQDLAPVGRSVQAAGAIFHIDAAQAIGRIPVDVSQLGCDLMTVSGHKLGALAGIGALFVRNPASIDGLLLGGPQERGLRAGTPNLLGAVGFGAAAAVLRNRMEEESRRMAELSGILLAGLSAVIPGLEFNSPRHGVLPNTLNLQFPGVLGETMLIALDLEGIEVSMGSACAAGAVEPSHVLIAMGRSAFAARSSLRISLGYCTTAEEVNQAIAIIASVWRRITRAGHAETAESRL
ncbi:MAG: cysteine desulfurase family protein [Candidatus Binataceae bacterium]